MANASFLIPSPTPPIPSSKRPPKLAKIPFVENDYDWNGHDIEAFMVAYGDRLSYLTIRPDKDSAAESPKLGSTRAWNAPIRDITGWESTEPMPLLTIKDKATGVDRPMTVGECYRIVYKFVHNANTTGLYLVKSRKSDSGYRESRMNRKYAYVDMVQIVQDIVADIYTRAMGYKAGTGDSLEGSGKDNVVNPARTDIGRALRDCDVSRNKGKGYWTNRAFMYDPAKGSWKRVSVKEYRRAMAGTIQPKYGSNLHESKFIVRSLRDHSPSHAPMADSMASVDNVLNTLTPDERAVVSMCSNTTLSMERIAGYMGVSTKTAYNLKHRAERKAAMAVA